MVNVSTVNKKESNELLPSFVSNNKEVETSFKDMLSSITKYDNNSYNNYNHRNKPYQKSNSTYVEKNYQAESYREKNAVRDYNDDNRYSKPVKKSAHSSYDNKVEKKEYTKNDIEKNSTKDIDKDEDMKEYGEVSNTQPAQEVSNYPISDILNFLQNIQNGNVEVSNDDMELSLENIDLEEISQKLNLTEQGTIELENIADKMGVMSKVDLKDLIQSFNLMLESLKADKSIESFAESMFSGVADIVDLENAVSPLKDILSQLSSDMLDNGEENILVSNEENIEDISLAVATDNEVDIIDTGLEEVQTLDESNTLENIDEAVSHTFTATDILSDIVSFISSDENFNKPNLQGSNTALLNEDDLLSSSSAKNINMEQLLSSLKDIANKLNNTNVVDNKSQEVLTPNNISENLSSEENITGEIFTENNTVDNDESISLLNNINEDLELSENVEKSEIELASDIDEVIESAKEQTTEDAMTAEDLEKEFKTANVEVSESVRGEAKAEAEAKVKTVTFNDMNNSMKNSTEKEISFMQSNNKENFSSIQSDKGNNFNYFLKSEAEVAKAEGQAQPKEVAQSYNLREPKDITRLMKTIQSTVNKGESKLTVVLTPDNMGKLQIQLTEQGGKITAKFISDNETSHKMIMSQSDLLKNQLSEKGITIDSMEFAFNDAMTKQGDSQEQGRRTGKMANKIKNIKNNGEDIEVGTQVATNKSNSIYA